MEAQNLPCGQEFPNLRKLALSEATSRVSVPFDTLLTTLPRQLLELDLGGIDFVSICQYATHLPPQLERLRCRDTSPRSWVRAPQCVALSEIHFTALLPSSITDLDIALSSLELSPGQQKWFYRLPHLSSITLGSVAPQASHLIPATITTLKVVNAGLFGMFQPKGTDAELPAALRILSTAMSTIPLQFRDGGKWIRPLPSSNSLTSLIITSDVEFQFEHFVMKKEPQLLNCRDLDLRATTVDETLLAHVPAHIRYLSLYNVRMQGLSLPQGLKSLESTGALAACFKAAKRHFDLILFAKPALNSSMHLTSIPSSIESLAVLTTLTVKQLPPGLTRLSLFRITTGCMELLPRTLTYLSTAVVSNPMGTGSYLLSSELQRMPLALQTIKNAYILLEAECLPIVPESGVYKRLRLPMDAQNRANALYGTKCDLSSCEWDGSRLLSSMKRLPAVTVELEGGIFEVQKDFQFAEGLLELDIQKASFCYLRSIERVSAHGMLPQGLKSLKAATETAERITTETVSPPLPSSLTSIRLCLTSPEYVYKGNSMMADLPALEVVEIFFSNSSLKSSSSLPNIPAFLSYHKIYDGNLFVASRGRTPHRDPTTTRSSDQASSSSSSTSSSSSSTPCVIS